MKTDNVIVKVEFTPLQILLSEDFDEMGYDDRDNDYDDAPIGGLVECMREF